MSDYQVRVLGLSELTAGMATLFRRIDEEADSEFGKVADEVAGQTRSRLPRRTGALAGSVESKTTGGGGLVGMGDGVPYAVFVEFGGRGHPHSAQGNYLYPTALDAEPTLVAAGERAANREVRSMRWPSPR